MSGHEHQLEASLIRSSCSLRRFYRGRAGFGRIWVQLLASPYDAPVWSVMTKMSEDHAAALKLRELDDTLAMVDPRWAERDTLNRAVLAARETDPEED